MFKAAMFFIGTLLVVGVGTTVPLYLIQRRARKVAKAKESK